LGATRRPTNSRGCLGKSSLLQAGLFPLLRETDHLPLYLRLDHNADAPPLAEQVKAALNAAFIEARADAPTLGPNETLWEYFHRKDVDIWSAKNRLLTPVLACVRSVRGNFHARPRR
jgi:hypothetical protein